MDFPNLQEYSIHRNSLLVVRKLRIWKDYADFELNHVRKKVSTPLMEAHYILMHRDKEYENEMNGISGNKENYNIQNPTISTNKLIQQQLNHNHDHINNNDNNHNNNKHHVLQNKPSSTSAMKLPNKNNNHTLQPFPLILLPLIHHPLVLLPLI